MAASARISKEIENINNLLPFGSSSKADNPKIEEAESRIHFFRGLVQSFTAQISTENKEIKSFQAFAKKINHKLPLELHLILLAALAKFCNAGNCGEQSAIAFRNLLAYFSGQVELIRIEKDEKETEMSHEFLVFNREQKDSDFAKPETWSKGTIVLDVWAQVCYQIEKALSLEDLLKQGNLDPSDKYVIKQRLITQLPCSTKTINLAVEYLSCFLEFLKKDIGRDAVPLLAKTANFSPDRDLKGDLITFMNNEIKELKTVVQPKDKASFFEKFFSKDKNESDESKSKPTDEIKNIPDPP